MDGKLMKLKLLILIMILPFTLMAAQTNVSDNVLIRNNFQFTGGVVGSGKVLTSDAVGYWTPQSLMTLGAFAVTNAPNFFTTSSLNTFNAPTYLLGSTNIIGAISGSSTNIFYGQQLIGTNSYPDVNNIAVFAQNGVRNNVAILGDSAALYIGDPFSSSYGYILRNGTAFEMNWQGSGAWNFRKTGVIKMILNDTSFTVGDNSAFSLILNGSAVTIPNGINIGAGQLIIPSTGTLTNNSSFVSLNMVISSNLVATTTDLIGRINTGTSTNLIITVNGSAGLLQTQAQFERRTNTFQNTTFLNNIIQTNTSLQRIYVRAGQIMPTGIATHSAVEAWTVGGGSTNQVGILQTPLGVSGQYTNNIAFWVNPGELFWVSNVNVGAGAPVAMPSKFVISSF